METDIKNALSFSSNVIHESDVEIDDDQLARIKAVVLLEAQQTDPEISEATADMVSAFLWKYVVNRVAKIEKIEAEKELPAFTPLTKVAVVKVA